MALVFVLLCLSASSVDMAVVAKSSMIGIGGVSSGIAAVRAPFVSSVAEAPLSLSLRSSSTPLL